MRRKVRPRECCARVVVALFAGRIWGGDVACFGPVEHCFDLLIHNEDGRRIFEVSAGYATNNGDE